jgi:hypothetical protein
MTRRRNILSSSFGILAVVLLVLGVLTVSPYAWGDDPVSCTSSSDCGSGYTCVSGYCVPQACDGQNPCPDGYICNNGTCEVPQPCSSDADCPNNETCGSIPATYWGRAIIRICLGAMQCQNNCTPLCIGPPPPLGNCICLGSCAGAAPCGNCKVVGPFQWGGQWVCGCWCP